MAGDLGFAKRWRISLSMRGAAQCCLRAVILIEHIDLFCRAYRIGAIIPMRIIQECEFNLLCRDIYFGVVCTV